MSAGEDFFNFASEEILRRFILGNERFFFSSGSSWGDGGGGGMRFCCVHLEGIM